jgi:hypothetical protein
LRSLAIVALAMVQSPSLAAQATRDAGRGKAATTRPAPSQDEAQFGRLLSSLNNIETNTRRFLGITGITPERIRLIDVSTLLRGGNARAYDEALARRERQLTTMRNDLQNCIVLRDMLLARTLTMSQVVAVDVAPDGSSATVYYAP